MYPCGFMDSCVCERCTAFHLGCGFSSAITQRCSQFVVDLPLSPSLYFCLITTVPSVLQFSMGRKIDSVLRVAIQLHSIICGFEVGRVIMVSMWLRWIEMLLHLVWVSTVIYSNQQQSNVKEQINESHGGSIYFIMVCLVFFFTLFQSDFHDTKANFKQPGPLHPHLPRKENRVVSFFMLIPNRTVPFGELKQSSLVFGQG